MGFYVFYIYTILKETDYVGCIFTTAIIYIVPPFMCIVLTQPQKKRLWARYRGADCYYYIYIKCSVLVFLCPFVYIEF